MDFERDFETVGKPISASELGNSEVDIAIKEAYFIRNLIFQKGD